VDLEQDIAGLSPPNPRIGPLLIELKSTWMRI